MRLGTRLLLSEQNRVMLLVLESTYLGPREVRIRDRLGPFGSPGLIFVKCTRTFTRSRCACLPNERYQIVWKSLHVLVYSNNCASESEYWYLIRRIAHFEQLDI